MTLSVLVCSVPVASKLGAFEFFKELRNKFSACALLLSRIHLRWLLLAGSWFDHLVGAVIDSATVFFTWDEAEVEQHGGNKDGGNNDGGNFDELFVITRFMVQALWWRGGREEPTTD